MRTQNYNGDIVEARFTNNGKQYQFRARITRINKKSLWVISLEKDKPRPNEDPNREWFIAVPGTIYNGVFDAPEDPREVIDQLGNKHRTDETEES